MSSSSIYKNIGEGLAITGRINAVIGAIVGSIIMIILLVIGYSTFEDKHTAKATMQIKDIVSSASSIINNSSITYIYVLNLEFTAFDGNQYSPKDITINSSSKLMVGDSINLRYNPNNPIDVVKENPPKTTGLVLIGIGLAVGALTIGTAVLMFKSKGFAEISGVSQILRSF